MSRREQMTYTKYAAIRNNFNNDQKRYLEASKIPFKERFTNHNSEFKYVYRHRHRVDIDCARSSLCLACYLSRESIGTEIRGSSEGRGFKSHVRLTLYLESKNLNRTWISYNIYIYIYIYIHIYIYIYKYMYLYLSASIPFSLPHMDFDLLIGYSRFCDGSSLLWRVISSTGFNLILN